MLLDNAGYERLKQIEFELARLNELNIWTGYHRPQSEAELEAFLNYNNAIMALRNEKSEAIKQALRVWSGYKTYEQHKAERSRA